MTGRFRGGVRCRSFVQIHTNWQLIKYVRFSKKTYEFVWVRLYEFIRNSHLVKYIQTAVRSGWYTVVKNGWTWPATILRCLNNAQLVLRVPKWAKKIPPTPLHHPHHQSKPLRQCRMDPCICVLYAKFWPYHLNVAAEIETHQTRQRFSNLLLSNFGEPVRIVASVSCS